MDVFLSAATLRTLQALNGLAPAGSVSGLLLGHKRAGRFFVEAAFPAPAGFRPDAENFPILNETFQGRIIGFFLWGGRPADNAVFLQPLACGRCLITVARRKSGFRARPESGGIAHRKSGALSDRAVSCRAYAVDYDGRFRLDPIAVVFDKPPIPRRRRKEKAR